jgi:hypothetical protein
MDVNKIFDLFDDSDDLGVNAIDKEDIKSRAKLLNEFKNHPALWIGMFHRIISNHPKSAKALITVFKTAYPGMSVDDIENAGEFIIYNRAYDFISKLDIHRDLDLLTLKNSSNMDILISFKLAVSYFEEKEEYEKCMFLLTIQKIIEENIL